MNEFLTKEELTKEFVETLSEIGTKPYYETDSKLYTITRRIRQLYKIPQ